MGNVMMEASQINYRGGETKMSVEQALKETSGEAAAIAALQEAVGGLQSDKADLSVVAPAFSADASYDVGDIVAYAGVTYRCTNSHEGEWDADDFAATTVAGELSSLESGLTSKIGIANTSNLNECITSSGVYAFAWDATGVPSGHSGVMLVLRNSNADTGMQIARVATENTIYVRFFDNTVFTSWQTVTLSS